MWLYAFRYVIYLKKHIFYKWSKKVHTIYLQTRGKIFTMRHRFSVLLQYSAMKNWNSQLEKRWRKNHPKHKPKSTYTVLVAIHNVFATYIRFAWWKKKKNEKSTSSTSIFLTTCAFSIFAKKRKNMFFMDCCVNALGIFIHIRKGRKVYNTTLRWSHKISFRYTFPTYFFIHFNTTNI